MRGVAAIADLTTTARPPGGPRLVRRQSGRGRLPCDMSASSDADMSKPRQPRVMGPGVGGAPLGICPSGFWHSPILKLATSGAELPVDGAHLLSLDRAQQLKAVGVAESRDGLALDSGSEYVAGEVDLGAYHLTWAKLVRMASGDQCEGVA